MKESTFRKASKKSVFILGGDFNVPDVSLKDNSITSSKHYPKRVSQTFLDIASDLGLEQMVQFPTRGENTLDLIFTSHPCYQERCKSLPPISERSDHDIVLFDTAHQPVRSRPKRRTIYLWKKADTEGIKAAFTKYSVNFLVPPSPQSIACSKRSKEPSTRWSTTMYLLNEQQPGTRTHG